MTTPDGLYVLFLISLTTAAQMLVCLYLLHTPCDTSSSLPVLPHHRLSDARPRFGSLDIVLGCRRLSVIPLVNLNLHRKRPCKERCRRQRRIGLLRMREEHVMPLLWLC